MITHLKILILEEIRTRNLRRRALIRLIKKVTRRYLTEILGINKRVADNVALRIQKGEKLGPGDVRAMKDKNLSDTVDDWEKEGWTIVD